MAGDNGGSAFVLIYLLAVLLIGIPVMLAEMLIGHRGRHNPINTMTLLADEFKVSRHWSLLGWMGILALLLVLSFYSVISGWSLGYFYHSITGQLDGQTPASIHAIWVHFINSPGKLILCHTLFMIMTMWVVEHGVQGGLEKASKYMMPILFLILIGLDIYGATLQGFLPAFHFLFDLKLNLISGHVVISALGHAFFTLAVGVGCMLVYASYVPKETKFYGPVMIIAVLDILVALLAGMAIFPIVFTHGLNPEGGPGLLFEILPVAFANMPGGHFLGIIFFILFIFAAWTSSISLAEPIVDMLSERYFNSRIKASIAVGFAGWLLGVVLCLSFNVWSDVKVLGRWDLFTATTDLATNILQPIGGLLFAIFAGYIMSKAATKAQLQFTWGWVYAVWRFLIRYIAPVGIIIIFVDALLS